jgi:hypothetical protein
LEDARRYLGSMELHPVEERDFVPWIWYRFKRQVQVYFNYCGAFRKESPKESV